MSVSNAAVERARARVGTVVKGKWQLEALLGVGGTACVYSAVHRNGRRVAIKVLHPELCAIESVVTRFLREGYLANKVGHPNAVAVLDDDRMDEGPVFLVMELLEGTSLERYAKPGNEKLPRSTVLRVVAETLDVLAAAHARGIVHRDIKPANLFLTVDGPIKVLDFGIARIAEPLSDSQLTQTGASIGTPSFMPPEQARGRWDIVDARTDVWAVGATMYALLKGDRPRQAETMQEEMLLAMTQPLAPLASVVPDVSPEVAAVVDRAVSYDRDARWPDATAMREAVGQLLAFGDPGEGTSPRSPRFVAAHSPAVPTVAVPDVALTTGRPLASQPLPSQRPRSKAAEWTIFAVAGAFTLAALGGVGVAVSRRGKTALPPAAAAASSPRPITVTEPPTVSVASSAVTVTTGAPEATTPEAAPSAASSGAVSSSPSNRPAITHPAPRAVPRAPAVNPFDQRF